MARKRKESTPMSVIRLESLPRASSPGRERTPSQYESELRQSVDEGIPLGILYDGTDDDFKRVARELKRGARHLGYGLQGPTVAEHDGSMYACFQAHPERRQYTRRNTDPAEAEAS